MHKQQFGSEGSSKEALLKELAAYFRQHELPKIPLNPNFVGLLERIKIGGVRQKEVSPDQKLHLEVMKKLGVVRASRGKLAVPESEAAFVKRLIENHKLRQRQGEFDRKSGLIR